MDPARVDKAAYSYKGTYLTKEQWTRTGFIISLTIKYLTEYKRPLQIALFRSVIRDRFYRLVITNRHCLLMQIPQARNLQS